MKKNKKQKLFLISSTAFVFASIIFSLFFFSDIIRADETAISEMISVSAVVPPDNTLVFSGKACPLCEVYLEQDGIPVASETCDSGAEFQITLEDTPAGTYLFELYAVDTENIQSDTSSFTITVSASRGVLISTSNILISPTLQTDESAVTKGKKITFFGQTVPGGIVTIVIDGSSPFIQVNAASDGEFYYEFDSSSLDAGSHSAEARVTSDGITSSYGLPVEFEVEEEDEDEDEDEDTCKKADYGDDNKVGLVDFSILLHWYGKNNVPDEVDLNGDERANLKDFSILMHCWDE